MHSRCTSREDEEFDFCIARESICIENFSDHISSGGGGELECQAQDSFGAYSSPFQESNNMTNITDSSPLLPYNHHYCNLSPASARRGLILESRRELMEMIHNIPESCYELSLKDIVDQQHGLQEDAAKESVIEDRSFHFDTEAQIRKQKRKKKSFKTGQLSRIESMEDKTFLIKMFFPITPLSSNKKGKQLSRSKVTSRSSPKRADQNHKNKKIWTLRFIIAWLNKSIFRKSVSKSNNSTRRCADTNLVPGCWSFLGCKNKSRAE
ncbi:hypothetical protein FEM48_Zijuj08G0199500 [Ziziphus jujuba var. spinosa]|uniref:Uncharacterized protein n=1 Tax=Ziziphus jujuba var. spinosa TaxID=714518 RepID=A0A978V129_ZIZJJ|nr:hypothetical protein FEM48_Zijuj08G0199500 [Ziziphus jujuba var. spinosa]